MRTACLSLGLLTALVGQVLALPTLRAGETGVTEKPPSLAELAKSADMIVLAQVRDTDYRMRREFPVSGSAYLAVLISYKQDQSTDLVEVYEKGLHAHECYFPNPTVFEEGRRYLLFLRRDPEDSVRYRGLPQGCALEVLVDSDNRYAVRYPADGIAHGDNLAGLATELTFSDGYSLVSDEDLLPDRRNALLKGGHIKAHGDKTWRYTRGIELGKLRRHIGQAALSN